MPIAPLVPLEALPLIGVWGGPSVILAAGVIAVDGFLAVPFLAVAAVRFARPPRK
ncbi:MAG TPA: hypothetical protein VEM77_04625 [Thermoplasmata archaeon]|nr:hypothetical protein [Thermoplasmata archaeon]